MWGVTLTRRSDPGQMGVTGATIHGDMATLRELRDRAFLTVGELAAKAGVSARTIQRAEHGSHYPRRRNIRKIARALKVDPREIEFPAQEAS